MAGGLLWMSALGWGPVDGADLEIHGFGEFALGSRLVEDPALGQDLVLSEARAQLQLEAFADRAEVRVKIDFVQDEVLDESRIEVREVVITATLAGWLDVKIGRQVLTWGTGDLLFINDQFPKDYVSFFSGRDDEYLKRPSDAVKASLYVNRTSLDLVWTPSHTPDRFLTGERLSFGLPPGAVLEAEEPPRDLDEGEWAARLSRTLGSTEVALYGYVGRHGQPVGLSEGLPFFPRLKVVGGSVRRPLASGIAWLEGARTWSGGESVEFEPPDQWRGFLGYEREVARELTAAVQLALDAPDQGESRSVVTLRLTRLLRRQTIRASLFGFVSPDDGDGHLRPSLSYDFSDALGLTVGGNVFWGDSDTEFGRLEDNTSAYFRARYSF